MSTFNDIGNIPFDLNVLRSIFPSVEHINEKARNLQASGKIIRLKRGLYVANSKESGRAYNRMLIANHIYGPSYVSFQTALRHYGLIPEQVYLIKSLTTKHARNFDTPIGNFDYENCKKEYFPIGIRQENENGVTYLIATPEKALCDMINYSKGLKLRFLKDVAVFLEKDIRFDIDKLPTFDISIIKACSAHSRKKNSIDTLIKYLEYERYI